MTDLDAFRGAKLLLDQYGNKAELVAALRADELDAAGRRAWMRILAALDELTRMVRRPDEPLH